MELRRSPGSCKPRVSRLVVGLSANARPTNITRSGKMNQPDGTAPLPVAFEVGVP